LPWKKVPVRRTGAYRHKKALILGYNVLYFISSTICFELLQWLCMSYVNSCAVH